MARCVAIIVANNLCEYNHTDVCSSHTARYPTNISDPEWSRQVERLARRLNLSFTEASAEFRRNRWAGLNYEARPRAIWTLTQSTYRTNRCSP